MADKKRSAKNNSLVNKAVYFIIFAFLFIFPAISQASQFVGSTSSQDYNLGNYTISKYHVDANLKENNTLEILEEITVNPNSSMRGIVRSIPVFQKVVFKQDGKEYNLNYKTKVENISSNQEKLVYEEDGHVFIRLGNEFDYFSTPKVFNLSYNINLGDDRISAFDQLYYNIIGTDWDVPISNISFNITMPKELDAGKKMFINWGEYGSSNEIELAVETDLVTYSYAHAGSLSAYEGITVRVVLEEGYFNFTGSQLIAWIASIVALAVIVILSFVGITKVLKIKKQIVTPVVMFSAPQGLPPSELGYIIDGVVDNQDISSLIVYWAEKGFIKIKEDNKKFTLEKVAEMEDGTSYEKALFEKIFNLQNEIALEEVGPAIYTEVYKAKQQIKLKHEKTQFNIENKNKKQFSAFVATSMVTLVSVVLASVSVKPLIQVLVAILGLLSLALIHLFMHNEKVKFKKTLDQNKDKTLFYALPIVAIWFVMALLTFDAYFDKFAISFLVLVPAVVFLIKTLKLEIRNKDGLELFGEVLGFKQFISFTEKDRIALLAKENPDMFYKVLPYAYVLGVSDEWINKFEGIALAAPNWYQTTSSFSVFDYLIMRSIFNSIMFSSMTQMAYKPVSTSGHNTRGGSGGFGGFGGGFTGGGFGGGGGRGW